MPAGLVRPRASQAPRLGAGAVLDYRERGWMITAFGRVSSGIVTGPCARCRAVCVRYGPHGRPLCPNCHRHHTQGANP